MGDKRTGNRVVGHTENAHFTGRHKFMIVYDNTKFSELSPKGLRIAQYDYMEE